jgi:alpha-tubulin suppressor-like RCC1 family protein
MRKIVAVKAGSSKVAGWRGAWTCVAMLTLVVLGPATPLLANTIAGGYLHSAGVKTDGTVVAWGNNDYGQCNVPEGRRRRGSLGRSLV